MFYTIVFILFFPENQAKVFKYEMYEAVITLVKECEISDSKKKALLKYYKGMGSYEFLARVFQRAVLATLRSGEAVCPSRPR